MTGPGRAGPSGGRGEPDVAAAGEQARVQVGQQVVDAAHDLVGRPVAEGEGPYGAAQFTHRRRLHAVPLDVADDQGHAVPGDDHVVPVAPHLHALRPRQMAPRRLRRLHSSGSTSSVRPRVRHSKNASFRFRPDTRTRSVSTGERGRRRAGGGESTTCSTTCSAACGITIDAFDYRQNLRRFADLGAPTRGSRNPASTAPATMARSPNRLGSHRPGGCRPRRKTARPAEVGGN